MKSPGSSPIRRLTRLEYDNTVRDLLGDSSAPARDFAPEEQARGFNNNAEVLGVTALLAEQYEGAAASLAKQATDNLTGLVPCEPSNGDATCAEAFLRSFGERAFRRPVSAEEVPRLMRAYDWGKSHGDFRAGIQMLLEALLQSPNFLYRTEFGSSAVPGADGVVRLSSWEMASRLSYFLWGTMPDAGLFERARADQLISAEQVAAEARRMLADPRTVQRVQDFHAQWLELEQVAQLERDPNVFAGYSTAVPPLLARETQTFINEVLWHGDGSLRTLLQAPYTYMNGALAQFYGVPGPSGEAFEKVSLEPSRYAGVLTQGGLLSLHSAALSTSPVHRGKFVREQLLCQTLPPPPADLVIKPPDLDASLTTRERFAQHSAQAQCASCHRLMDPLGLGFESFDAVGRFRSTENGKPVDASGELVNADVAATFNGPVELAALLARSSDVAACVVTQWVRYAYGRSESAEDACTLQQLGAEFSSSNYNIVNLLVSLTQTDAFLYRKAVTP